MTTYTSVFGGETVPPSEYSYAAYSLAANTTFTWPYNTSAAYPVANITEINATVASLNLTMPDATQVSTGQDVLFVNTGANTFTVLSSTGVTIATVASGAAIYLYLKDNSTASGTWNVIAFGVGASSVNAASLVGYGIVAIGSTLNQALNVYTSASNVVIDTTYRAQVVAATGTTTSVTLPSAATAGNNFFFLLRNAGTGTLTVTPNGTDTVDGQASVTLQPTESLILCCSGSTWYSIGYGRSVVYNFTQLVLDVSGGGTFTLTAAQASNKLLTFIGNPAAGVNVVVPNVVSVYYLQSSLSTSQTVTVKTAAGTGVVVPQTQRTIAICDSTNVVSALSIAANTSISLVDGSVSAPAVNFASSTNSGLYKYSGGGLGFAVLGTDAFHLTSGGAAVFGYGITSTGNITTQAAVTQDAVTLAGRAGGTGSYAVTLTPTTLSASRTVTLPNASTSLPIATQFLTFSGPTAARTITLPDASFSAARIDAAQSFTGLQTFNSGVDSPIGASAAASTYGYRTVFNNTQTNALYGLYVDMGSSAVAHDGYYVRGSNAAAADAFMADMQTGFTGNLFHGVLNGVDKFVADYNGNVTAGGNATLGSGTSNTVQVNGYMGVGGAGSASAGINVTNAALTGTSQYGVASSINASSAATTKAVGIYSYPQVVNAAFTVANVAGLYADTGAKGAAATATNWHGLYINDQTQGTNNYGITLAVSAGANKLAINSTGTADSKFAGGLFSYSATAGIGYATGAGGTVIQTTSRTTGVTLNKVCGSITLVSAAGTAAWQTFTVTNSAVAVTDVIRVCQKSGTDLYQIHVTAVAAGSFNITYATTGGTTTEQPVFNFTILKGVTA